MERRRSLHTNIVSAMVASITLCSIGVGLVFFPSSSRAETGSTGVKETAAAAAQATASAAAISDPVGAAGVLQQSAELFDEGVLLPAVAIRIMGILGDVISSLVERAAYESAVYVATGGPGEDSLFYSRKPTDAWKEYGLDLAGFALDSLSDEVQSLTDSTFDICAPSGDLLRLNLALGIKQAYQPPAAPRCDFRTFDDNWEAFTATAFETSRNPGRFILNELAKGFDPSQNQLAASITLTLKVQGQVQEAKQLNFLEQITSAGFKPLVDIVTGDVKTPASTLQNQLDWALTQPAAVRTSYIQDSVLTASNLGYLGLTYLFDLARLFTGTFVNTWLNRTLTGLFEPKPHNGIDLGNYLGSGGLTREDAEASFSKLLAINPISVSNYNAIAEFVTCTGDNGVLSRGVNNCVLDSKFASALTQGQTTGFFTVKEAIEKGFLRGDWPLIPPTDQARNQDPFCYNYGYCYGNIVKLRKARILPVGWEIAAKLNDQGNTATLREVVDAFYDCNSEGEWDEAHKWCHLIDPNWVLKYPETQCRATTFGDVLTTSLSGTRAASCVDTPSCIAENSSGQCVGGYGYCVREKNVWQFAGASCPAEYASCLSFANTRTSDRANFLINTVDYSSCSQSNAGCQWFRTQKTLDTKGTEDTADDSFEWLPSNEVYNVTVWDEAVQTGATTTPAETPRFAYQDRVYFNGRVSECPASQAGCTELVGLSSDVVLNVIDNPEFADDANQDGIPDGWSRSGANASYVTDADEGLYEARSVLVVPQSAYTQSGILLAPNTFYTVSFHARSVGASATAESALNFQDPSTGVPLSLANRSVSGENCSFNQTNTGLIIEGAVNPNEYGRFSCTFTTPSVYSALTIGLTSGSGSVRFDGIQLEVGEILRNFTVGYAATTSPTYLKVPPVELNCTGSSTDPEECAGYAQVCQAQDVGCTLYTPLDGDPSLPAVASAIDACPTECVGYASYKQEETRYEASRFPVSFIPSTADVCTAEQVGCDGFTNLGTVAGGGESIAYFTTLRACQTAADAGERADTYYTWEGSDRDGYQLQTWSLLRSNAGAAPCTSWRQVSETSIICEDVADEPAPGCSTHDDIYFNPDCREFYDGEGTIHYRLFSDTVTIDNACTPYRKNTSTQNDCERSGGLWLANGECRYAGLSSESVSCPAAANGCRAFTGGTGRNATILLNETFEAGTYEDFEAVGGANLVVSNESLSAGGRSLQVTNAVTGTGFQTVYDDTDGIRGPLASRLVAGKTFSLEFWVKGSGSLQVFLRGDGGAASATHRVSESAITLGPTWKKVRLGPIDSSDPAFADIDGSAVLQFLSAEGGTTAYIDNIYFKQSEETLNLVKDSWTTPLSCDTAPNGDYVPEYYLGCEAYRSQRGETSSLYQFTRLCSESVVGCQAFFDTQNTNNDPSGMVRNARCEATSETPVLTPTSCTIADKTYCTIQTGRVYCTFNQDAALPVPLPASNSFRIALGPEAVVVPNDVPVYLVDNGTASCSAANIGCEEVGLPIFRQDKKTVERFESKFLLNQPASYDTILCDHESLFCEEWTSTQDGNFYFKAPGSQTCEFRSGVRIGGTDYSGWFRSGTNDPCSFEDTNNNGRFDAGESSSLLIGGTEYGIARNGDEGYEGWVASCPEQYDLCTEFRDPTDSVNGKFPSGKPYYYLNNSDLTQKTREGDDNCQGEVSQKNGCALFNELTNPTLPYAAQPSYIASAHADVLFGDAPDSLQAPIDCSVPSRATIVPQGSVGNGVNLCLSRCAYTLGDGVDLGITSTQNGAVEYAGSCLTSSDCPAIKANDGVTYSGTCTTVDEEFAYKNDANLVIEVNQNRECAEWLACKSNQASFDPNQGKWVNICNEIGLCNAYSTNGDASFCSSWVQSAPVTLTPEAYAERNTTWSGLEYAGYAIPDQLPVDVQTPINLNPSTWCEFEATGEILYEGNEPKACTTGADCGDGTRCVAAEDHTVLAFNAGSCNEARGTSCTIGQCENTKASCGSSADCRGLDEDCVIGSCQVISQTLCSDSSVCGTGRCDTSRGVCVQDVGTSCTTEFSCGAGQTCVPAATTKEGACYDGACLTNVYGEALSESEGRPAEEFSCRGYPEANAPFSSTQEDGIITAWFDPETQEGGAAAPQDIDALPFARRVGFTSVNTCAPTPKVGGGLDGSDCSCTYKKITYGKTGSVTRYYPENYAPTNSELVRGVCSAGPFEGKSCTEDADCQTEGVFGGGTCLKQASSTTYYGFQGFCLERDTSIQLFGSGNAKDRACLSWFPVDQLTGATNLFAKNPEAGLTPDDTFYCADVQDGFYADNKPYGSLQTFGDNNGQGGYFCTEDTDGQAICPVGYFAVTTGLGSASGSRGGDDGEFRCGGAAYFCVPSISFHTDGDDAGYPCYPPKPYATPSVDDGYAEFSGYYGTPANIPVATGTRPGNGGTQYVGAYSYSSAINNYWYIVPIAASETTTMPWTTAKSHYADCRSPMLPYDLWRAQLNNISGGSAIAQIDQSDTQDDVIVPVVKAVAPACESLVRTNSTQLSSEPNVAGKRVYNLAWTDRVKPLSQQTVDGVGAGSGSVTVSSGPPPSTISVSTPGSTYSYDTLNIPFGAALPLERFILNRLGLSAVQIALGNDGDANLGGRPFYTPEITYGVSPSEFPSQGAYNSFVASRGSNKAVIGSESYEQGANRLHALYAGVPDAETSYYRWFAGWFFALRTPSSDLIPVGNSGTGADGDGYWVFAGSASEDISTVAPWTIWKQLYDIDGLGDARTRADKEKQLFQKLTLPGLGRYENRYWSLGSLALVSEEGKGFGDFGVNQDIASRFTAWTEDRTSTQQATPPVVKSVGACEGTLCQEGREGAFSVNGKDTGSIDGGNGSKNVTVSYFMFANPNQLPIRSTNVDWGDGNFAKNPRIPWPTDSQSGSTSNDNFYKNRRGATGRTEICTQGGDAGQLPESCDSSYVSFTHSYSCSVQTVARLQDSGRLCELDPVTGALKNSPCTGGVVEGGEGRCVYQPRVHVEDNWGWCTGYCNAGVDLDNDGSVDHPPSNTACYAKECSNLSCPAYSTNDQCADRNGATVNPWINFDGYVRIAP